MVARTQNYPTLAEMLAMGFVRHLDSAEAMLYGASGLPFYPEGQVQGPVVPTTGQTVAMTNDLTNGILYLNPAGTLATLTVQLPALANGNPGQVRRIITTQTLTALTVALNGGGGSILGNPTSLAANTMVSFMCIAAGVWAKMS